MDKLKDKNPNFLTERERKASKLLIKASFLTNYAIDNPA
jgi:hypothetical protein